MDLNRIAALRCCSWYFNKKRGGQQQSNLSQFDEEDFKTFRKQYGICLKCGQTLTDYKYCQSCTSKEFQSKFKDWTSGNQHIDDFIRRSQLNATNKQSYLAWIPYDDLMNIKYLANGGFTSVYSGSWVNNGHVVDVVLKRLHNGEISNPEFLKQQVSIFLFGAVYKSNIVRCYGFTKHPTEGYMLVLECAQDGDLRNFLRKQSSTLLWLDKLSIIRDISISLGLFHENEIIHGDLHTGNILKKNHHHHHQKKNQQQQQKNNIKNNNKKIFNYKWNSREIIIDIPLCFSSDISYITAQPYGVIPYVAPEVYEKGYYTKQSDIYSFGIVIWELSTNQTPFFEYANDKELVNDIRNGIRPEIDNDQPIPKCVVDLINKCWDPEPLNRPTAKMITNIINEWIWILSTTKIRLSNKSKIILNQFSLSNNTTKKKIKRQSKVPALSRIPTMIRSNNYYSKSLSKYLIVIDVERSANASSFSSADSVNSVSTYKPQDDDYYT